jgi:HPt (histidine-containing phosphotransfer) domain-containing protein
METQSEAAMNREVALDRLGGDAELLDELIVLMIAQSREFVATIRAALADGDTKAVAVAAHTIKGSAANLEATALTQAAQRLEVMARTNDLAAGMEVCAAIEAEVERLARDCAGI